MTPDERGERDRQLLDGLLKSFGEMSVIQAKMETQITADRERHLREISDVKRAVRETGVACKARIDALEEAMIKEAERIEAKRVKDAERLEARRQRNEVTTGQKLLMAVAVLGIFLGPVVTVLVQ